MTTDIEFAKYIPKAVREYWDNPDLAGISEVDRECLRRLVEREEMASVYERLSCAFRGEYDAIGTSMDATDVETHIGRRIATFLHCAWNASLDFQPYRSDRKDAPKLLKDIDDTAERLASLLRSLAELKLPVSIDVPSVRELLNYTLNPSDPMWMAVQHHVTGLSSTRETTNHESSTDGHLEPGAETDSLNYAWGLAPDFSDILHTLAVRMQLARERTNPTGMVGAAIASQKGNIKTDYIRAFIHLLRFVRGIKMTRDVIDAVATAAEVVLNDADITVEYGDVRKSFIRLGGNPPEDWPKYEPDRTG